MNDNKLLLDQVVLKKEIGEDDEIIYKALAFSIVEHKAINMTTQVLDDKTIVMTPSVDATFPFNDFDGDEMFIDEGDLTDELPSAFEALFGEGSNLPE